MNTGRVNKTLYVLKRYPRLSETFIVREVLALESLGTEVLIDALLPPEDGPVHEDVARVRAVVRYLPRSPRLRHRQALIAHARAAARHPARWTRLAVQAKRARLWRRFVQAGIVAERARKQGIDHIHAHFATAAAEVARDAAALAGIPFTVTAHAKDIYHHDNAPLLARRVNGAAAVVTVSEHNAAHLRTRLPAATIAVVRNGVPAETPIVPVANGPVVCVARLVPKKGIDVLLEAAATLARSQPSMQVEIIGDGPLRDELVAHARRLGLDDRVAFRGALSYGAVAAAYERASMVVLPCRVAPDGDRDGMPTVLVEAMGRGLPVISTDIVGIGELVRHGETGLTVAPDDAHGLAAAIEKLWADAPFAQSLGRAGRELIRHEADPLTCARRLLAVWKGPHR